MFLNSVAQNRISQKRLLLKILQPVRSVYSTVRKLTVRMIDIASKFNQISRSCFTTTLILKCIKSQVKFLFRIDNIIVKSPPAEEDRPIIQGERFLMIPFTNGQCRAYLCKFQFVIVHHSLKFHHLSTFRRNQI